jgi:hypothetical protein
MLTTALLSVAVAGAVVIGIRPVPDVRRHLPLLRR